MIARNPHAEVDYKRLHIEAAAELVRYESKARHALAAIEALDGHHHPEADSDPITAICERARQLAQTVEALTADSEIVRDPSLPDIPSFSRAACCQHLSDQRHGGDEVVSPAAESLSGQSGAGLLPHGPQCPCCFCDDEYRQGRTILAPPKLRVIQPGDDWGPKSRRAQVYGWLAILAGAAIGYGLLAWLT